MKCVTVFLVLVLGTMVFGRTCYIEEDKEKPGIQILHLPELDNNSDSPTIVAVHLDEDRRKREASSPTPSETKFRCKVDEDCETNEKCFERLLCVKKDQQTLVVDKETMQSLENRFDD